MFEIEKEKMLRAERMVELDELRHNYVEKLSAKTMGEISDRKAAERAQATIRQAARSIVDFAHTGSVRCYHVDSKHPDVVDYFRERGFTVKDTDHISGILVEW